MEVYIMRHGSTVYNEKGITQGRTQNRLSKKGIESVKKTAQEFADTEIDVIFSSPLMRTVQTANIMNVHKKKVIKDPLLIEVDQGIFTGRKKSTYTMEEKQLRARRAPECGMESFESVRKRCKKFLNSLKAKDYKSVLIVTHNANASLFEDLILGIDTDLKNIKGWKFENAQIKHFEI